VARACQGGRKPSQMAVTDPPEGGQNGKKVKSLLKRSCSTIIL
jgi:hypothetical protein